MTSAALESGECKRMQAESSPEWLTELRALAHRSVIATNMMWLGLAGRRFSENLSFPAKLAECRSVFDLACAFRSYHRAVLEHYEGALTEFRRINLTLASEVPFAGLVSARSAGISSGEQTGHSSVAGRDS